MTCFACFREPPGSSLAGGRTPPSPPLASTILLSRIQIPGALAGWAVSAGRCMDPQNRVGGGGPGRGGLPIQLWVSRPPLPFFPWSIDLFLGRRTVMV